MRKKTTGLLFAILFLTTGVSAQVPSSYYSDAYGFCGEELKTALCDIIDGHSSQSYSSLWSHFQSTDKKSNGYVWDMYSDVPGGSPDYDYTFGSDQCGNYSGEGSCYNREHSFPKSWFNDASPMYSDLFHLYPTDGYVNGRRSNYPFGEVGSASWTSSNGCKVGTCDYPGYSGTVFEPIDEYKGDFARTYFYMATRYENQIAGWENNSTSADAALNGTSFPCYEAWYLNMILEWHTNDPVSQKEIDRNDEVYDIQGNRNPYIDHPEYVNAVWGSGCSDNPVVTLSVSLSSVNEVDETVVTITATASEGVAGDQAVTVSVSGLGITSSDYTLSTTTLTISDGTTTGTVTFTIDDDSDLEGTETATISISNPSDGIVLGETTQQTISIIDDEASDLPTINLSVSASVGSEVEETVITVTGTTSESVSGNQTVSVSVGGTGITSSDYTLSSTTLSIADGLTSGTVTFTVTDDSDSEGEETAIINLSNPSIGVNLGSVTQQSIVIIDDDSGSGNTADVFENFDTDANWSGGAMGSYNAKTYINNSLNPENDGFSTDDAVRETSYVNSGDYAWRVDDDIDAYLRYETAETIKSFSIYAARWDNSPQPTVSIRYSTNSGTSYTEIETINGDWFSSDKTYKQYNHTFTSPIVPESGKLIYIEFVTTSGERMMYDDFSANFQTSVAAPEVNLSVSKTTGSEADETLVTVTATATESVSGDQSVAVSVAGTGITSSDYSLSNTTLTIADGETTGTITFTVVDDAEVEGEETAAVSIYSPSSGIVLGTTTTQEITITDDDFASPPTVNLSLSALTTNEADESLITIIATASESVSGNQTVAVSVTGTNITIGDYNLSDATLTIADGATSGNVTLVIVDDMEVEGSETAVISISSPTDGIVLGTTTRQELTITDDDSASLPEVNLSISSITASEADETAVTITATASETVSDDQRVAVEVSGAGITSSDYSLSNTFLTIVDGATSGTIIFTVINDTEVEGVESAKISISNPSEGIALGATIMKEITITDDDSASLPEVNLSLSATTASEADETVVTITGTATKSVSGNQTVDVSVAGTGITSSDYSLSNTTLTIADGGTFGLVTLTIANDTEVEGNEIALIRISSPADGIVLGEIKTQELTIVDDDSNAIPEVNLSLTTTIATEFDETQVTIIATTSESVSGDQTVAVDVSGTAVTSNDYILSNSILTIADGTTSGTITLTVVNDTDVEADEIATVSISDPSDGIVLGTTTTQDFTIIDDDILSSSSESMHPVLLYPNPVVHKFTVVGMHEKDIVIVDCMGRAVKKVMMSGTEMEETTFDVSLLKAGMYFVTNGTKTLHFIKQ